MNKAEFEALPIVEVDGVLWREENDPRGWVDDSDRTWEIFRHNGVLSRRIARRWVPGNTRTMRSDKPAIHSIPKDPVQALFELELTHLDFTRAPQPKFAGPTYANEQTEASWVGFRVAMRATRMGTFERSLSRSITDVWNQYNELEERLSSDDEKFARAIHELQSILALRVARRAHPEIWGATNG